MNARLVASALTLSLVLAACQTNRTPASALLQGTTNTASILPEGTWTYAGDAAQYSAVQILQRDGQTQVTASLPGDYTLTSGARTLTYRAAGPVTGALNLTEINLNPRQDGSGWIELYNGTGAPLDLQGYALRAPSRDRNGQFGGVTTFSLPNQVIAPGEYVLVTGQLDPNAENGPQAVFVASGTKIPFWQDQGEVQLLHAGTLAEQVQFGQSLTGMSGSGPRVQVAQVAPKYTSSITRALPTGLTASAADTWFQTVLPSPGAPNNTPTTQSSTQDLGALATGDTDNDGIPDSYETSTSAAYGGIYVYNLGARQNQRDIFVEIDWMNSTSEFIRPKRAGIDKMVAAFKAAGYALHVDTGYWFNSAFSTTDYNLGGGNQLGYSKCIGLGFSTSSCSGILTYKYGTTTYNDGTSRKNFALNRLNLFRYVVLGNSQQSDGSNGSSGVAEIAGNDAVVTMGGWSYASLTQVANQQGSTIMHEFGHTLNLRHGGFENTNNKPNYYSTMNYTYQLAGLDDTADAVWERAKNRSGSCSSLTYNDPCMTSFKMDYSYGQGGAIDEGAVNENAGINRGTAWIDWNNNGAVNTSVRADVNGDNYVSTGTYRLNDYNDWANIRPTFGYVNPNDSSTDVNGASAPQVGQSLPRLDVASNDVQPFVPETDHQP